MKRKKYSITYLMQWRTREDQTISSAIKWFMLPAPMGPSVGGLLFFLCSVGEGLVKQNRVGCGGQTTSTSKIALPRTHFASEILVHLPQPEDSGILYCTVLYNTVQNSTLQSSTVQTSIAVVNTHRFCYIAELRVIFPGEGERTQLSFALVL